MVPRHARRPLVAALAALVAAGAAALAISSGAASAADEPGSLPASTDTASTAAESTPAESTPAESTTAESTTAQSTTAESTPAESTTAASSEPASTDAGTTDASNAPTSTDASTTTSTTAAASTEPGSPGATTDPSVPTEAPAAEPDTTPPLIAATVVGLPGVGGWFVGDVQVTWIVTDAESPLGAVTGCGEVLVDTDAAGLSLTCSASSAAGDSSATVVIYRDATAPSIVCPSGEQRIQGSGATLVASVLDDASGPASPTASAGVDTAALGLAQVAIQASDIAGNTTSAICGVEIIPDTSAPIIGDPVLDGPMGQGGWYIGDVSVQFPVADPDSALISVSGCGSPDPQIVSVDSEVVTCAATSSGGTSTRSVTVARDATGPLISCPVAPSIVQGSTRSLTAAVSDAVSGPAVLAVSQNLPTTSLGGATVTLSAQDLAGNGTTVDCGYLVVPDLTPPSVAVSLQGQLGTGSSGDGPALAANGAPWYIGPVTVSFGVTEDESILLGESGCGPTVVAADTAGQVVTCSATSFGATTTRSVTVAVDRTPPVVTCSGVPAYIQGSTGIVSATFSDAMSGPTALGATVNVNTTALGTSSISIGTSDAAGNLGSQTCTYRVIADDTKPLVTPRIQGKTLAAGWYTGPVVVTFDVDDPESPVLTTEGCQEVTVNADAVDQVAATCRATSYGGTTVEPITISRDSVAPVITCLSLRFVQGATGKATANATDATSGVASQSVTQAADTSTPGTRAVVLSSTDRAGNTSTQRCTYEVVERKTVSATKLSSTGSDLAPMMLGGVVLALAGTLLAVVARRRAHTQSRHRG